MIAAIAISGAIQQNRLIEEDRPQIKHIETCLRDSMNSTIKNTNSENPVHTSSSVSVGVRQTSGKLPNKSYIRVNRRKKLSGANQSSF